MKRTNELKVGIAIVASVIVFVLGVRYFEDVPLLRGTYALQTDLVDAKGLTSGNAVRVSGVRVGAVKSVSFDQSRNRIRVRFNIDKKLVVPQGSTCRVTGFEALGGLTLDLALAEATNPPIPENGLVPSSESGVDVLAQITDRAPALIGRIDTVLAGLGATLRGTQALVGSKDSELSQTLQTIRTSVHALGTLIESEQGRVSVILDNLGTFSGQLSELSEGNADTLSAAFSRLNQTLATMDKSMASVRQTTARLDRIAAMIESGEGTLGRLVRDPGLYVQLDSVATNLNLLLEDLRLHPRRYLRELNLIDLF